LTAVKRNHHWPRWPQVANRNRLLERLAAVVDSGLWTLRVNPAASLAREVEREICRLSGRRHCVLVNSGTTAVELAAAAVGAGPGREVIVPALGWHATAEAVRRTGAVVRFADIDRQTSCIAPEAVAAAITERTVAIIAVHLHCAIADMEALAELAGRAGVALIEDAAQAHGASSQRGPVGSLGTIGCFSFNQEKLLPAGEGGAVVTDDPTLHSRVYAMRTDGYRECLDGRLVPDGQTPGHNAALSEFQAAVLLDQLEVFRSRQQLRDVHAYELEQRLTQFDEVRVLSSSPDTVVRSYYEFGIILPFVKSLRGMEEFANLIEAGTGIRLRPTDR